jgi:Tfp pilus assembly protein PilF
MTVEGDAIRRRSATANGGAMLRKRFARVALLVLTAFCCASQAIAVDSRLPGVWTMTLVNPHGQWTFTWNIASDGTYHTTITGTVPLADEWGQISTDGNGWSLTTVGGRQDKGTFEFSGEDLLLKGTEEYRWKRNTTARVEATLAPSTPTAAKSLPSKVGGALADIAQGTIGNAANVLQKYAPPALQQAASTTAKSLTTSALPASSDSQVLFNQGMALKDAGNYSEAATKFTQALATNPQLVDAHYHHGVCLLKMQEAPQIAIQDFAKVINAQPTNAKAWCMRGIAELQIYSFASALHDFDRAIQLNPKYGMAYGYRGMTKLQSSKSPGNDLETCYSLEPSQRAFFERNAAESRKIGIQLVEDATARRTGQTRGQPAGEMHPFDVDEQVRRQYEQERQMEIDKANGVNPYL